MTSPKEEGLAPLQVLFPSLTLLAPVFIFSFTFVRKKGEFFFTPPLIPRVCAHRSVCDAKQMAVLRERGTQIRKVLPPQLIARHLFAVLGSSMQILQSLSARF